MAEALFRRGASGDPKTQQEEPATLSFPSLMSINALAVYGNKETLYSRTTLDPVALEHLLECESSAGERLVPVGMWGDGTPCNWDRSESLEIFSYNLPGLPEQYRSLRIPFTAINKKFKSSTDTFDDIMQVFQWSMEKLAV